MTVGRGRLEGDDDHYDDDGDAWIQIFSRRKHFLWMKGFLRKTFSALTTKFTLGPTAFFEMHACGDPFSSDFPVV